MDQTSRRCYAGCQQEGLRQVHRWVAILLIALAPSFGGLTLAATVVPAGAAAAAADGEPVPLSGQPQALAARGSIAIGDAAAGRMGSLLAASDASLVALAPDNELWIRLRLHNPSGQPSLQQLQFVLPSIDEVTLFEQRGDRWTESSAGDRVPLANWRRPGRFPSFGLRFEPGETRELFVRVRNAFPAPIPLRLVEAGAADAAEQRLNLVFGVVLGALALLVVACLVQAAVYRDSAYFLYGAYALFLGLSFAALSGLAGLHGGFGYHHWNDLSKSVFPLAGAGVSVWLVRALCSVAKRGRTASLVSAALGWVVIGMAIFLALWGSAVVWLTALAVLVSASAVLAMAAVTWRRGDPMGVWVFAAHAPIIAVTGLIILRMFGVAPFEFDANILISAAIGLILPLLLAALQMRSKEFLTLQMRVRDLASLDPSTGLLSAKPFAERVNAAVGRYRRSRHNAVIVYVRLANHQRIVEVHGNAVAEQSMIRSAMKLKRLMPDADCVGRVGESTIGLILETVTARPAIMERAARLVAHGLMPLKGLKPEVILNFQVAANSLAENPVESDALLAALEGVLASMSPRTRRPIRFLDSDVTRPAPLDGVLDADDDGRDEAIGSVALRAPGSLS
jgi:GGDEF domain-containing protein